MRASRLASLLSLAACGSDAGSSFLVVQLVARDGEDPFEGAATARVTVEADEPTAFDPVPIDRDGDFEIDVDLSETVAGAARRARIEADDADGEVVSRGATPFAPIGALAGFTIRLLVSPPDSAAALTIPELPPLRTAAPLFDQWILGLDEAGGLAMLDLLTYSPVPGVSPLDPPRPGARLVDLGGGRTLLLGGGDDVFFFDGSTNSLAATDDGLAVGSWRSPTVAALPDGGAVAVCDSSDALVVWDDRGAFLWGTSLAAPRERCAAVVAGDELVVYGGGADDGPAAELVDLASHEARILSSLSDPRRAPAAVALGETVFVLGGAAGPRGDGSVPLDDGVRLDLSCEDGCPEPLELAMPRGAPVAVALEGSILVASDGTAERFAGDSSAGEPVALPEGASDRISTGLLVSTGDVWLLGGSQPIIYAPR